MSPEDVKPEWVEKAVDIFADEYIPGEDAPRAMRLALAAVLPEAMTEAWVEGRDDGLDDLGATQTAIDYGELTSPYEEES
jgi:hypothetical protein